MAIVQAMCTSFKVELLTGHHAFGTTVTRGSTSADTFKIALYVSAATLGATTTTYGGGNEVAAAGGYSTGGNTLTVAQAPTSTSTTAWLDFADTTWAASTITARGALIYNNTQGNRAIAVLDFGSDKSSTSGNFTIQFPTPDSSNAIIRIA